MSRRPARSRNANGLPQNTLGAEKGFRTAENGRRMPKDASSLTRSTSDTSWRRDNDSRDLKRPLGKVLSSDDGVQMFWKASPRHKRVKEVHSSPSKATEEESSLVLEEESLGDIYQLDLSQDKNGLSQQPQSQQDQNHLNKSILASLKTIKKTTEKTQTNTQDLLDANFSNLLQQIGNSMMRGTQPAGRTNTVQDSLESSTSIASIKDEHTKIEGDQDDKFSDDSFSDDDMDSLIIQQLSQRPATTMTTATITTVGVSSIGNDEPLFSQRPAIRNTTTEATAVTVDDADDSFSDDDLEMLALTAESPKAGQDINLAKSSIVNPSLHRFQIKEISLTTYKRNNMTVKQKVLKCLDENDTINNVVVRDFWSELDFRPFDIVHVISENGDDYKLIDRNKGLLIWNPDELISPTKIGSATYCLRESVIKEKFKGPGEVSEAFVIGNITHSLFQSCLKHRKIDDAYINAFISQKLEDNLFNIYSVDISRDEIEQVIRKNAQYIKKWIQTYYLGAGESFKVSKILDIEESIVSPTFGLRGYIDVVIEACIAESKYVIPMEIKSGKEYISNRAQAAMYTLMVKDRYDIDCYQLDLVYTKLEKNCHQEVKLSDLKHLIHLRNCLSQYLLYDQTTLPPLKQRSSCERCFTVEPCMVLNKLAENGKPEDSGINVDLFTALTDHITDTKYGKFFNHWDSLITKEEGFLKSMKNDLYRLTSEQREETGGACLGNLALIRCDYDSEKMVYFYEFERPNNKIISKISKFDLVTLSEDGGSKFGLDTLLVKYVDAECVVLSSKRRWIDSGVKAPGFDPSKNQTFKSVLTNERIILNDEVKNKRFRIDKNVFVMGLSTSRWNLLNLFLPGGDSKRRELIVELRSPEFRDRPNWKISHGENFNSDQTSAFDIVSKMDDYALILGMPGTGKTTVISHIIKSMLENDKTVLITSYTHSAVDNICEKLIDILGPEIPLLRLGSVEKVHAKVQPYCLYSENFAGDISSKKAYRETIENRMVVAATCFGIADGIFGRYFDYCIVDEASQVPLPVVLGPISYADKFILVGDHYQLPPLVVNPEARKGGLDKSLFQLLNDVYPQSVVELSTQYRMNEEIMTISNHLIYDGRLRCGNDEVAQRRLSISTIDDIEDVWIKKVLNPEQSVAFVDYADVDGISEHRNGDQIENVGECEMISQLVEQMVLHGVNVSDIGLMSFYNGQLRRFRQRLDYEGLEMLTADKFQGRDKDVIIISLVRTDGVGELLKEMRRINVAMTRAKRKLVVFGHGKLIEKEIPTLMKAFTQHNWVIQPEDFHFDSSSQTTIGGRGRSQAKVKVKGDILKAIMQELE